MISLESTEMTELWPSGSLKGNFTPNISLSGWKGAWKQTFPPSHFFELIHLLKENSPLIQNLVLLGRSSGRKRKKFGRSSRGKRKKFGRSFEGKWKSFFHLPS